MIHKGKGFPLQILQRIDFLIVRLRDEGCIIFRSHRRAHQKLGIGSFLCLVVAHGAYQHDVNVAARHSFNPHGIFRALHLLYLNSESLFHSPAEFFMLLPHIRVIFIRHLNHRDFFRPIFRLQVSPFLSCTSILRSVSFLCCIYLLRRIRGGTVFRPYCRPAAGQYRHNTYYHCQRRRTNLIIFSSHFLLLLPLHHLKQPAVFHVIPSVE